MNAVGSDRNKFRWSIAYLVMMIDAQSSLSSLAFVVSFLQFCNEGGIIRVNFDAPEVVEICMR